MYTTAHPHYTASFWTHLYFGNKGEEQYIEGEI